MVYIFTDGSCVGKHNERSAGWAVIVYEETSNTEPTLKLSGKFLDNPTNQRAELYALKEALQIAKNGDLIYTDSEYSRKCITLWSDNWIKNGWKTANNKDVLNRDIIEPIVYLYKNFDDITIKYIKAHQKGNSFYIIGNRFADQLATQESR
tara:strand:- start:230 stop:682 length:453 start_codon:yes stop_codon:yes gene_type:complete